MPDSMSLSLRILEVASILGAVAIFVAYLFRARKRRSQSASSKNAAFSRQYFIVAILMGVGTACRAILMGNGDDRFLNWLLVLIFVFSAFFTRLHPGYQDEGKTS